MTINKREFINDLKHADYVLALGRRGDGVKRIRKIEALGTADHVRATDMAAGVLTIYLEPHAYHAIRGAA